MQICRRRAEETSKPEQVSSERKAVAQRRGDWHGVNVRSCRNAEWVQSTSWMPHQQYVMQPTGAVITPAMDHTMSMQPASMMGPLTQQMNHLSLGTTGSYMTAAAAAAAPMQGTYIPQYTPVPPTAVPVEGVVTDASPQTVAPSSQEVAGQQQQIQVDSADHVPAYSYQSK